MFIWEAEKSALKTANKRWNRVASLPLAHSSEIEEGLDPADPSWAGQNHPGPTLIPTPQESPVKTGERGSDPG